MRLNNKAKQLNQQLLSKIYIVLQVLDKVLDILNIQLSATSVRRQCNFMCISFKRQYLVKIYHSKIKCRLN